MKRLSSRSLVLLAGLLMGGCAQIPHKEFASYRAAFDQARTVAREVIIDYAVAKEEHDALETKRAKPAQDLKLPFPIELGTAIGVTDPLQAPAIATRLAALDAIALYNDTLLTLAEGKSAEQAGSAAGALVTTIGSLVTLTPGIGPLISGFVEQLERARTREEFKRAVTSGEPVLMKILDVLVADALDYYDLRFKLTMGKRPLVGRRISDQVVGMATLAKNAIAPPLPDELKKLEANVNSTLQEARGLTIELPFNFEPAAVATNAAVAATANGQLVQALAALQAAVRDYNQIADQQALYHSLLINYASMLRATKTALVMLRMAIDRPEDLSAQVQDVLSMALRVRRDVIKFREQATAASKG